MLKAKSVICRKTKRWFLNINHVRYDSSVSSLNDEYKEKPEYPPIYKVTPIAEESRKKLEYYEQLKKLGTVEEKLFALNVPRYYGWPAFLLKEGVIPYNFFTFIQHITRTELYETDRLPVKLETDKVDALLQRIKPQLEKVLIFEKCAKKFKFELTGASSDMSDSEINNAYSKDLIQQINRIFINNLVVEYPHLLFSQVDYTPRLESFWRVGGFYPTAEDKKLRKFNELPEERFDEPIERCFQYTGSPVLQIRSRLPLSPFFDNSLTTSSTELSCDESNAVVPVDSVEPVHYPIQPYNYDPYLYYRVPRDYTMAAVSPGFWPNDPYQFGLLSYLNRGHLIDRPPNFGETDLKESLHSQGILSSYAWTLGQACYQGFSTFYDITYPFVTQTIITDGQLFNFYAYQLNTTVLHSNFTDNETNPLKNRCDGTTTQELYHEIQDNKIIGWNDQVLYNLLSFYTNIPSKRTDVDMQPYLDETKVIANIEDVERRVWLHEHYRYHASKRPRELLMPEIYDWERIYKVEFNKRPFDARRKFFEIGQDPIHDRKLFQHSGKYIPKALRAPGTPRKARRENTYYPLVYPDYVDIV